MTAPRRLLLASLLVTAGALTTVMAQTPATAPPPGAQTGRGGFAQVQIGPPAPVPPEVAIPRPTEAERAEINDAVKKFIDSNKSSSKDVLKKYASLLIVPRPRLNVAATYTQTAQRMGPRHEGFVQIAKAGNIDLLLHGDSITDLSLIHISEPTRLLSI